MHAKIAAQKQEYVDRQAAAMRNKAAVEDNIRGPSAGRAGQPQQQQPRRQWQDVEPAAEPTRAEERDRGTPPPAGREGAAGQKPPSASELSPEQRRAAWEELQEAAKRNRQAAGVEDNRRGGGGGGGGGLAAFLGVPEGGAAGERQREQARPTSKER